MPRLKVDEHGYAEFRDRLDIFQRRRVASTLQAAGFRVREGHRLYMDGTDAHFVRLHISTTSKDRQRASRMADKALRDLDQ